MLLLRTTVHQIHPAFTLAMGERFINRYYKIYIKYYFHRVYITRRAGGSTEWRRLLTLLIWASSYTGSIFDLHNNNRPLGWLIRGEREVTSKVGVRGCKIGENRKKEGLADEESPGCLKEGFWKCQISQQHAFRINPPTPDKLTWGPACDTIITTPSDICQMKRQYRLLQYQY